MKFFIFLSIFLLGQIAACSGSFRERSTGREPSAVKSVINGDDSTLVKEKSAQHDAAASLSSSPSATKKANDDGKKQMGADNKPLNNITSKSSVEVSNGTVQTTTVASKEHTAEGHLASLNSGALLRGFYVFVGLGILVMAYMVFRRSRLSKPRAQMVRKYGILAHRQDVEMRPLPLEEEDDEDTTVFDASNVLSNNTQHQNL
ncbi:hypothetical protein KPH14_001351 [Odynerus spinipes]|uniref:Uncharacterized protein n=1 Tax=Odynerus spinipes TaxID=1348599 RepID=A0AAD9REU8_9HYME|nr:hypothetical protein KPH14_001351 [Odynerus spinipes]